MHADFLEYAAVHHRHHAAAAGGAAVIGAIPRRAHEAARRTIGQWRAWGQRVLQRLEGRDDPVAQVLEPGLRRRFALLDFAGIGFAAIHGAFVRLASHKRWRENVTITRDYIASLQAPARPSCRIKSCHTALIAA